MFSIPKLLVLIAIIAAVWWGFKMFGRNFQQGRDEMKKTARRKPDTTDSVSMEQCEMCGDFVAKDGATNCGDDDCPY